VPGPELPDRRPGAVKGKDVPVAIHEPLGVTAELPPQRLKEAALFEAAFADYQARRWTKPKSS